MSLIGTELLDKVRSDSETRTIEGASTADIDAAQKAIGVRFPPSYSEFLRQFNGGWFRDLRLHRIGEDRMLEEREWRNFDEVRGYQYIGDLVHHATDMDEYSVMLDRSAYDEEMISILTNPFFDGIYTRHFFLIGDDFKGNYFCFDMTRQREDGECPVLQWDCELWSGTPTWRADTFADFLGLVYRD